MKRFTFLLLCTVLVLTGCSQKPHSSASEMVRPASFYYLSDSGSYHTPTGSLMAELRDLGDSSSMEQIVSLYLSGPNSEHLWSPFLPGTVMEEVTLEGTVLRLTPGAEFFSLQGADLTLAAACLVHTMTQLPGVEAVVLQASNARFTDLVNRELTTEDFLLSAYPDIEQEHMVSLYFPDQDSRSLLEETRPYTGGETTEELAAFVLRQLLNGSTEDGLGAFPKGTNLLDVQLQNGTCTVNLSSDFSVNRPETALKTRMALLAVVNSLTAIEEIESVVFSCENHAITDYNGFDLSLSFIRDESVIASYSNSAAKDITLYLPYGSGEKLIAVPVQLRRSTGKGTERDVLGALIAYEGGNGIINPIPADTMIAALEVKDGRCDVTFNSVLALADNDPQQATMAVRSIVTTLCALPSVDCVQVYINGNTMTSVDISEPMTAIWKWITP